MQLARCVIEQETHAKIRIRRLSSKASLLHDGASCRAFMMMEAQLP
jgi:hypothetical protein